jgi:hypothetical protein
VNRPAGGESPSAPERPARAASEPAPLEVENPQVKLDIKIDQKKSR